MLTAILMIFGIMMIISGIFSFKQTRTSADVYADLKKQGQLVIGQQRGGMFRKFIVAFAVGSDGKVKDAVKISGMGLFQKAQQEKLNCYKGKRFSSLDQKHKGVDDDIAKVVSEMVHKNA